MNSTGFYSFAAELADAVSSAYTERPETHRIRDHPVDRISYNECIHLRAFSVHIAKMHWQLQLFHGVVCAGVHVEYVRNID